MSSRLDLCRLIELPRIEGEFGSITPVQGGAEIPFGIERVFYVYDVVAGAVRGGHAHRSLEMVCVAAMGGLSVELDDGHDQRSVTLRQPHVGLYIPTMVWSDLVDFASGTIAVVLCSQAYDESEYIRDHATFLEEARA